MVGCPARPRSDPPTLEVFERTAAVLCWIHTCIRLALLGPAFAPAAQTVQDTVTRVVDGNTLWAEADVHSTKLCMRLVGIDAPKVGHPRKGGGAGSPGCGRGAAEAAPRLGLTPRQAQAESPAHT